MEATDISNQIDHLFRQESGKMVAVLVSIFGPKNIEMAEDVVQNTLLKALEIWKYKGIPEQPKAWLYRVAKNNALDIIKRENRSELFDASEPRYQLLHSGYTLSSTMDDFWEEGRIKDEFLSMMFASCHPDISTENQVTFILKTLCGFSTKEIAKAFLTSEDVISKRIYRTKEYFRANEIRPSIPANEEIDERLNAVISTIYLMFNEGYSSTHSDNLIRKDLIVQALYLAKALLDNDRTNYSEVQALMALMCFHTARIEGRIDRNGVLVLLADQDRNTWNKELIEAGKGYLFQSGKGNRISTYHFEALIAYEHCIAKTYATTNWKAILDHYEQLLTFKFDPVIYFNKCLVYIELEGPEKALAELKKIAQNKHIKNYYLYYSALGDVYARMGNSDLATKNFKKAYQLTKSKSEKAFLKQKIEQKLSSVS